ncbi:MAG: hypothetical protein ABIV63_15935 [Caldimonas sp.]
MHPPATPGTHSDTPSELESSLAQVEARLTDLGAALRLRDTVAIDLHAGQLQHALTHAVERFSSAARIGPVPSALRTRLASASGQVAAQRESLARATAALDRAIDVLLPPQGGSLYSALGAAERGPRGGVIQA